MVGDALMSDNPSQLNGLQRPLRASKDFDDLNLDGMKQPFRFIGPPCIAEMAVGIVMRHWPTG